MVCARASPGGAAVADTRKDQAHVHGPLLAPILTLLRITSAADTMAPRFQAFTEYLLEVL